MAERPPKILVVDDVPENVRLLQAVLVPRGYEVVTAGDGLQALEVVEAEEPDLILLDVMMPGLDGYGVCTHLRANDSTAYKLKVLWRALLEQKQVLRCSEVVRSPRTSVS